MEAGFVTVRQGRCGSVGEGGKGVGGTVEVAGSGLGGDLFLEHAGFDGPGAAQTPVGGHHLLDHGVLDAVGRVQTLDVSGHDGGSAFGALVFEDQGAGQGAVTERVPGGAPLAGQGFGALGESAVGAGCQGYV